MVIIPWSKFTVDCGTDWNAVVFAGLGYVFNCDIQEFAN